MIDRYRYDSIRAIFADHFRLAMWAQIEIDFLRARHELGDPWVTEGMIEEVQARPVPAPGVVAEYEAKYGHDVVAFLAAFTAHLSRETQSQIHVGLTSSDLVETALFAQLESAAMVVNYGVQRLISTLAALSGKYEDVVRVGRTHGQVAEPTTLGWRFDTWGETASELYIVGQITGRRLRIMKTPGAVGNMRLLGEDVAQTVATNRRVVLRRSTQVLPRQPVIAWASWLVQVVALVEEIALEIRLSSRTEVGEMVEGESYRRAGSSAMPHKRNPIGSEQLSGLGRVARGYFAAVAETAGALHNERDISNSSVERTVVPDLAELTAYMVDRIIVLLRTLVIQERTIARNAMIADKDTALQQYQLQRLGVPYMEARVEALHWYEVGGWEQGRILNVVNRDREEYMTFSQFREAMEQDPWRPVS